MNWLISVYLWLVLSRPPLPGWIMAADALEGAGLSLGQQEQVVGRLQELANAAQADSWTKSFRLMNGVQKKVAGRLRSLLPLSIDGGNYVAHLENMGRPTAPSGTTAYEPRPSVPLPVLFHVSAGGLEDPALETAVRIAMSNHFSLQRSGTLIRAALAFRLGLEALDKLPEADAASKKSVAAQASEEAWRVQSMRVSRRPGFVHSLLVQPDDHAYLVILKNRLVQSVTYGSAERHERQQCLLPQAAAAELQARQRLHVITNTEPTISVETSRLTRLSGAIGVRTRRPHVDMAPFEDIVQARDTHRAALQQLEEVMHVPLDPHLPTTAFEDATSRYVDFGFSVDSADVNRDQMAFDLTAIKVASKVVSDPLCPTALRLAIGEQLPPLQQNSDDPDVALDELRLAVAVGTLYCDFYLGDDSLNDPQLVPNHLAKILETLDGHDDWFRSVEAFHHQHRSISIRPDEIDASSGFERFL